MATRIKIQVEKINERYCGNLTGRVVFHTSVLGCGSSVGAVLGRGFDTLSSMEDFVSRARADGHQIKFKDLEKPVLVDRT